MTTVPGELVRVSRAPDGRLRVGPAGGRGAWLHPAAACFDRAAKKHAFGKALRAPVSDRAVSDLGVALGL